MSRIDYREKFPKGLQAMGRLEAAIHESTLEPELLELVRIRASEINGCGFCLAMHHRDARARGESQTRLDTVAGWREAPFFSKREQAALAWCEAMTEVSQHGSSEAEYQSLAAQFTQEEIAALTFAIVAINSWNRLAVGLGTDVTSLDGLDLPDSDTTNPKEQSS